MKIKLDVETLAVESFDTGHGEGRGTVRAYDATEVLCPNSDYCSPVGCNQFTAYCSDAQCLSPEKTWGECMPSWGEMNGTRCCFVSVGTD